MVSSRIRFLMLLLGVVSLSWSETVQEKGQKIMDDILAKYDARIRPAGINGTTDDAPVVVSVNLFVRSISEIDDVNMEYSMQVTFRQNWVDERFKFTIEEGSGLKYLTLNDPSKIWTPDLFFSNENEAHVHSLMTPNLFIRIHPNGQMQYSTRISLKLSCPMNLKWFPFDQQICSLRMASYGWTTDDLVFLWKELQPVQVVKSLNLPRFNLDSFQTTYCTSKTSTGEYSCLNLELLFARDVSYYLLNVYLPSAMLVMASWISFWLDHSAITARALIGLTTLLAMVYQTLVSTSKLAPVSYTRSIDVWSGVCLSFLFSALVEAAVVNYMARSEVKKQKKEGGKMVNGADEEMDLKPLVTRGEASPNDEEQPTSATANNRQQGDTNFIRKLLTKIPTCSKRLDIISRVLFPLGFALFVILYWITNCVR